MKSKNLLLLTSLLLTQTAPLWAMDPPDSEHQHVPHIGFTAYLTPEIHTLDPSMPIPTNLGIAIQRVSHTFSDGEQVDEYPLRAQWCFQEDRDHTRDIATLKLYAILNNDQSHEVFQRQVEIPHTLIDPGEESPGLHHFNGDRVYQPHTKVQRWQNRQGQTYQRTLVNQDGNVHNHQNSKVIYVEPFDIQGLLRAKPSDRSRDKYRGEYHFGRDLADHEGLPGKKKENLIYSDGDNNYYLPHVTQELWMQGNENTGFFIASYKEKEQLNFVPGTLIPSGQLPEGLYQLLSVQDNHEQNKRTERWQKLGEGHVIDITSPAGVSSIAGMGGFAPHEIPQNNATVQVANLQNKLEKHSLRMSNIKSYIASYPDAEGTVVILGPTGAGKTVLAHILAGQPLNVIRVPLRGLRLNTNNPLPGFEIGHGCQAGTSFPAIWYDQNHNLFFADCPSFGDPGGAEQDILNAFSIHHLLKNQENVKIVVAIKEEEMTGTLNHLIKLLNDITGIFQNAQELQNNLSFVVTALTDIQPQEICELLTEISRTTPQLGVQPKNLLDFLAQNPHRVSSIPKAQLEGPFDFNAQLVQGIVHNSRYVSNPQVKMAVGSDAELLVTNTAGELNNYLTAYMKTEGPRKIINYCIQKIDRYAGAVGDLRREFATLIENLRSLPTQSAEAFRQGLKAACNNSISLKDMKQVIKAIGFLQTIKEGIDSNVRVWKNALLDTITQKLGILTAEPSVAFTNGALSLKSALISTSDVNAVLRLPQNQNISNIHIYSLNTLFIDEDILAPSTSVSFISPCMKIISGPKIINLSGTTENPDTPGRPSKNSIEAGGQASDNEISGEPGKNGGNFYSKVFDVGQGLTELIIKANGGSGGSDALVQAYNDYYQQQATDPNVAPFIKVFPNLHR